MTMRQATFPLAVLAITALIAGVILLNKKETQKREEVKPPPAVTVTEAKLGDFTFQIPSQGLVKPRFSTTLTAEVGGKLILVSDPFTPGAMIKKGQVLAKIEPFNYQMALEQANASLASARATFILERAQGQVAEAEWQQITSAVPSELGLRKPQQEQAHAAVKAAEAALKKAQKDLERTQIRAPFDGIILERQASLGNVVNIGSQLGRIAETQLAEVRLPLTENQIQNLVASPAGLGIGATVKLHAYNNTWQAVIDRSEGVVDTNTRMIHWVVKVKDPYNALGTHATPLPFGTFVTAQIQGQTFPDTLTVPRHWILDHHLPLAVNDQLVLQEVEILTHQDAYSVISHGVNNGQFIVTSALPNPTPNMPLKVQSPKEALTSGASHDG